MERLDDNLNFKATELRLGLPGSEEPEKGTCTITKNHKRASPYVNEECMLNTVNDHEKKDAPLNKTQVVGWPPIRSYRKNTMQITKKDEAEKGCCYVKVSVDGAPYLRKIDLKAYKSYPELLMTLENLFQLSIGKYFEREGYAASDYSPTYEDKDGDWMLVGDVPWNMFVSSCKRLRIMKGSEARGLTLA